MLHHLKQDWSFSATLAGLLAVVISYSGPLVIFFQAAQKANVDGEMLASWIWGVSIGSAITSIFLSYRYKMPVLLAWSIPGTALLVSLFPDISLGEVVGAYIIAAIISLLIGMSGYFDKILAFIPQGVAAGMMSGILFGFGVSIFESLKELPILTAVMLLAYVIAKKFSPRYAIVWVLIFGLISGALLGVIDAKPISFGLTYPEFISPQWSWSATLNLAIPLVILNLTGQFLPGMALLKLNGYDVSSKPIINTASIASLFISVVGGISIVLAAVTASLCMGKECHESQDKRYIGGIANGVFYLMGGLFAGSMVGLFEILPKPFVATLAGIALLGALLTNMSIAMQHADQKEPALITFLVTVSGVNLLGLSSVFWGVVIGMVAYFILSHKPKDVPKQDCNFKIPNKSTED